MVALSDLTSAAINLLTSQVRTTPTGITSDELMVDPSSSHGHQGGNDDFVLLSNGDNFQLFRSGGDLTFIYGHDDFASYWGGGSQTIYDWGVGTTLQFSELDEAQVKIYDFQNDPTGRSRCRILPLPPCSRTAMAAPCSAASTSSAIPT